MKFSMLRFHVEDLPRKLVALFFAGLIWWAVSTQLRQSHPMREVPVTLDYDPTAFVIEDTVHTVDVTLRGSPKRLEALRADDVTVTARIPANVPAGMYFVNVDINAGEDVHTPTGIQVVDVNPKSLPVRLDRIVTKRRRPVRVRFEGKLQEGFRRSRLTVRPDEVDIRGPHKLVSTISELLTEPVLLDDSINRDFETDVLLSPIPRVQMPRSVRVSVEITETTTEQPFTGRELFALQQADSNLEIVTELPTVSITLRGSKVTLDKLSELSVRPFIDLTAIMNAGVCHCPVQVWVDSTLDVTAVYVYPAALEVELRARAGNAAPEPAPPAPKNE